jgi:hypothetical protein
MRQQIQAELVNLGLAPKATFSLALGTMTAARENSSCENHVFTPDSGLTLELESTMCERFPSYDFRNRTIAGTSQNGST